MVSKWQAAQPDTSVPNYAELDYQEAIRAFYRTRGGCAVIAYRQIGSTWYPYTEAALRRRIQSGGDVPSWALAIIKESDNE